MFAFPSFVILNDSEESIADYYLEQNFQPHPKSKMRQYNFYTYILTNFKQTVLYVGITNNLERRLYEHYFGKDQNNSFTAKYKCFYLVWYERHQYVNNAIEREKEIKGWTRERKNKLIAEENPSWRFLNVDLMEWPPVLNNISE